MGIDVKDIKTELFGSTSRDLLLGMGSGNMVFAGSGDDIVVGDAIDLFEGAGSATILDAKGQLLSDTRTDAVEIANWSAPQGYAIHDASEYGLDAEGHGQVLELATDQDATYTGEVTNVAPGQTVLLVFDLASPQYDKSAKKNGIEITWNGEVVYKASPKKKGEWDKVSIELVGAESGINTLSFSGTGKKNDDRGVVIDNVALIAADQTSFDDHLLGEDGKDTLIGNGGNDWLEGGKGADKMNGGDGIDTLVYVNAESGITVNLKSGKGSKGEAKGDRFQDVENVHGSDFNDRITGDSGDNRLVGRDGDDILRGGAGDDTLLGGRGADNLNGGKGMDTVEYDWSTAAVEVNLTTKKGKGGFAEGDKLSGIENILGSRFDDELTGNKANNRLMGAEGDDVLDGKKGNDILFGSLGADTLIGGKGSRDAADYKGAAEGVTVDLVNGGSRGEAAGDTYSGIEYVYGSPHDDIITGDDGINRLVGSAGDDDLFGAGGNDYILGSVGNDTMNGGAGDDVFELAAFFGNDTIEEFEAGEGRTDRIWFRGLELEYGDLNITDTDMGAQIDAGGQGTILLEYVWADQLHEDDFIF